MKDHPTTPAPEESAHRTDPAVRTLILQAQSGSGDAHLTLRAKYRPLLLASLARFAGNSMTMQEYADLEEEAERIFLGAISTYDTEQDAVDFGLYAKICLRNGLVSEWRRMEARRRVSVLPLPEGEALVQEDPAERLVQEERFRSLCRTVRESLSDFENHVWWQYVTGVPVSDIARDLGRDERAVHNAIYRIRRKLRDRITREE